MPIPELAYSIANEAAILHWFFERRSSGVPEEVKDATGFALYLAQLGDRHPHAKPLQRFGGAGVLEVIERLRRAEAHHAVTFEET